jgi:hypothetical protein
MSNETRITNLPDNVTAAIALIESRNGKPHEDDWDALDAAQDLVKFIKELQPKPAKTLPEPDPNGDRLMPYYIGVKRLQAKPMTLHEHYGTHGYPFPDAEKLPDQPGYLVIYEDDYRSWSPKHIFESAYFRLEDETGLSIMQADVDGFFAGRTVIHETDRMVVCKFELANGYQMVEHSACVDASNFNRVLGMQLCEQRAEGSVWKYLGFLLRTAIAGVKGGAK